MTYIYDNLQGYSEAESMPKASAGIPKQDEWVKGVTLDQLHSFALLVRHVVAVAAEAVEQGNGDALRGLLANVDEWMAKNGGASG